MENIDYDNYDVRLNPQVIKLLEETGTNITNPRDLLALSMVSVKDLARLFDELAKGVSKKKALQNMTRILLKKLEEKEEKENEERRLREEIEKNAEKQRQQLEALERAKRLQEKELAEKMEKESKILEEKARELELRIKKMEEEEAERRRMQKEQEELERKKLEEAQRKMELDRKRQEEEMRRRNEEMNMELKRKEQELEKMKQDNQKEYIAALEKLRQEEEIARKKMQEEMERRLAELLQKEEEIRQREAAMRAAQEAEERRRNEELERKAREADEMIRKRLEAMEEREREMKAREEQLKRQQDEVQKQQLEAQRIAELRKAEEERRRAEEEKRRAEEEKRKEQELQKKKLEDEERQKQKEMLEQQSQAIKELEEEILRKQREIERKQKEMEEERRRQREEAEKERERISLLNDEIARKQAEIERQEREFEEEMRQREIERQQRLREQELRREQARLKKMEEMMEMQRRIQKEKEERRRKREAERAKRQKERELQERLDELERKKKEAEFREREQRIMEKLKQLEEDEKDREQELAAKEAEIRRLQQDIKQQGIEYQQRLDETAQEYQARIEKKQRELDELARLLELKRQEDLAKAKEILKQREDELRQKEIDMKLEKLRLMEEAQQRMGDEALKQQLAHIKKQEEALNQRKRDLENMHKVKDEDFLKQWYKVEDDQALRDFELEKDYWRGKIPTPKEIEKAKRELDAKEAELKQKLRELEMEKEKLLDDIDKDPESPIIEHGLKRVKRFLTAWKDREKDLGRLRTVDDVILPFELRMANIEHERRLRAAEKEEEPTSFERIVTPEEIEEAKKLLKQREKEFKDAKLELRFYKLEAMEEAEQNPNDKSIKDKLNNIKKKEQIFKKRERDLARLHKVPDEQLPAELKKADEKHAYRLSQFEADGFVSEDDDDFGTPTDEQIEMALKLLGQYTDELKDQERELKMKKLDLLERAEENPNDRQVQKEIAELKKKEKVLKQRKEDLEKLRQLPPKELPAALKKSNEIHAKRLEELNKRGPSQEEIDRAKEKLKENLMQLKEDELNNKSEKFDVKDALMNKPNDRKLKNKLNLINKKEDILNKRKSDLNELQSLPDDQLPEQLQLADEEHKKRMDSFEKERLELEKGPTQEEIDKAKIALKQKQAELDKSIRDLKMEKLDVLERCQDHPNDAELRKKLELLKKREELLKKRKEAFERLSKLDDEDLPDALEDEDFYFNELDDESSEDEEDEPYRKRTDDFSDREKRLREMEEAIKAREEKLKEGRSGSLSLENEEINEFKKELEKHSPQKLLEAESPQKGGRTIPMYEYDVSKMPAINAKWLRARFSVTKFDPKKRFFTSKKRVWEIDFFGGLFHNMSQKGKIKKSLPPEKLFQLEKNTIENRRLRLQFFEASHKYDLVFESNEQRERFFECAHAFRPTTFAWCPNLCMKGETKCRTVIQGKLNENMKGKCIINVTSQPYETITVWTGTYNMCGSPPPTDRTVFQKFMPPNRFDIYALAVQESGYSKNDKDLLNYVQACLGKDYIILASQQLWDIRLIVSVRKKHFMKITHVTGQTKATGYFNVCGNKGGVGIGMSFNETSMAFISCHLAANKQENIENADSCTDHCSIRNKQQTEIVDSILFKKDLDMMAGYQYIFWMGDLNYRLEHLSFDEAVRWTKANELEKLLASDQLSKQMKNGKAFVDFKEEPITFMPTYKFNPGTLIYNAEKRRCPSYCDRILYRAHPGLKIECSRYASVTDVRTSDHVPVHAFFRLNTIRPYASIFATPSPKCHIYFEVLSTDRRECPTVIEKPVVGLYASFFEEFGIHGSPVTKSSNPTWNAKYLPILVPSTPNPEYLRLQSIVIAVKDAKTKVPENVGTAVLPLRYAVDQSPKPYQFCIPMFAHGLAAGRIMGKIVVKYRQK